MSKKIRRISVGSAVIDVFIYSFLTMFAIMCIYPLWQIIVASVSDPAIVMKKNGMILIPQGIQFEAYRIVFANNNIIRGFANTLFYISWHAATIHRHGVGSFHHGQKEGHAKKRYHDFLYDSYVFQWRPHSVFPVDQ